MSTAATAEEDEAEDQYEDEDDTGELTGTSSVTQDTGQMPAPRAIGTYINGRYEVEWLLGTGGMGRVYRVTDHLYPDRPTALKTMMSHANEAALALFRAEFGTMAALDHPNLAKVYDFEHIVGSDEFLFTLEYLDGVDLRTHVRGGGWQPVAAALLSIGRALSYIHNQGLVHLDLKPSNVMVVASTKTVKVLDFGLTGMRAVSNLILGTIPYMAPEVMQGLKPDGRADLYSLGVMAFELLSGRFPHPFGLGSPEALQCKLQQPVAFSPEERARLPSWLCDLVEQLAATQPQARPASAGIFAEALTQRLNTIPGLADLADSLSRGVYGSTFAGRQREQTELLEYVRGRVQGATPDKPSARIMWVCGPSGMGKSRLVQEVRHQLQLEDISFIQGDCYDRDVGEYTALGPVLLSAATLAVAAGKTELFALYGPEIVKLVPGFGREQRLAASLPFSNAKAEKQRIHNAAVDFLLQVAVHIPTAIYLNDLQWAAPGTIDLLTSLIEKLGTVESSRLALLASYRSNELPGRPLAELVDKGPDAAHYRKLLLAPLGVQEVKTIASSMLAAQVTWSLAEKLFEGSQGQPLRIEETTRELAETGQLVVKNGNVELAVDAPSTALQLDISAAILRRAGRLGSDPRRIIDMLAICGRPVQSSILAAALELDEQALHKLITDLIDRHLVVAVAGAVSRYNLFHDRIRETLYIALGAEWRDKLHDKIGRAYWRTLPATDAGEHLLATVAHLNSAPLPSELKEREGMFDLNLRAARTAHGAAAFGQALGYLRRADQLLTQARWEGPRARGLLLAQQQAESAYSHGDFDAAQKAAQEVIDHAPDLLQEARGWESWILCAVAKGDYGPALDAGVDIANRLGARIPKHPTKLHILLEVLKFKRLLGEHDLEGDIPVQAMTDPTALQLVRLMSALAGAAFLSRASLFPDIMFEMARQSMRHGFGQVGAQAFLGPAITFRIIGDCTTAQRLTSAGERMLPKTHKDFLGKSIFLLHGFHRHLTQPWSATRSGLIAAQQASLAVGECEYAGHAINVRHVLDTFLGMPLEQLVDSIRKNKALSEQAGREHIHYANLSFQVVHELQQGTTNPVVFDGPSHQETEDLPPFLATIRDAMRHYVAVFYRVGISESILNTRHLSSVEELTPAGVWVPCFYQYACLLWLHACRQARPLQQRQKLLWGAWRGLRKLRQSARLSSDNHGHRATLLEAEWLRTWGRRQTAIPLYEQTVAKAERSGFPHEAALARELLAEVLLELGKSDRARALLRKARQGYSDWGATGKVRDLEARYAALLASG